MSDFPIHRRELLIGTGVFALLWVVARACVQSLTIDEASTYLCCASGPGPSHWLPGWLPVRWRLKALKLSCTASAAWSARC